MAAQRGVIFDVGHGGGSFLWRVAVPAMKAGFLPDSISTDLHISSMNAGMKDMLNVMSKFLALGMSLDDVVRAIDVEPGPGDQTGDAGASLDRCAGGYRRAARRARAVRVRGHQRRAPVRHDEAGVRADRFATERSCTT